MSYEELLIKAEEKGIEVKEVNMHPSLKGLYRNNKILINLKLDTNIEKKCILAEEIGHHETSSGNILDNKNIVNRKQELKARRWAYEHIIKLSDLIKAYEHGAITSFEIADYLNITEEFLNNCIINYKKRYGFSVEFENHFIYFYPYIKIIKKNTFNYSVI
ncbi:ImmA/IrrE family metallo-endopeptidase [Clostridium sp. CTA-5]